MSRSLLFESSVTARQRLRFLFGKEERALARSMLKIGIIIHFFRYRDNYVHLHECAPILRILIDKTLNHVYMLKESLILCKHGNILLSLALKENTISNLFYYIHIVEIPTKKDANSYKLKISEIGNFQLTLSLGN